MTISFKTISCIAMFITVSAGLITIKGCWKNPPNKYTLYAGDTVEIKGVSYTLLIDDSAKLILDYDQQTNLDSEEINLNNGRVSKKYYFNKKKYRTTMEYDSIRRELMIDVTRATVS